jgi:hypothetical protein
MSEIGLDDLSEDWASVKLLPRHTGLPRAVWITENQGYPHDARVKVSVVRGGGGIWPDAVSVSVRPTCQEIVLQGRPSQLPAADLAQVCRWIELNRDLIIDFWDGVVAFDDVQRRLRPLPP